MTEPPRPSVAAAGWDCHVHVFDAAAPVRAGHYRPVHRPLDRIEAQAAELGLGHLVLVQPSVYGADNALLLAALAVTPGRHRGVVVLSDAVDDATLDAMHSAGVRGVRLNLQSPVGEGGRPDALAARVAWLAPRLRARGWHLQWYAAPAQLPTVADLHDAARRAGADVVCVLDHLAGLTPSFASVSSDDPAWSALERLADGGAWIKLSGWYRLQSPAPHHDLVPVIRRAARFFGDRMAWGSDWPHTAFAPEAMPSYASQWAPVVDALGPRPAQALLCGMPPIYR